MRRKRKKSVPVYTVHTVPQPYEIVGAVSAKVSGVFRGEVDDLSPIGREGKKLGADAVIGITVASKAAIGGWDSNIFIYGTAIKYIEE